jgi:transcriptional regulator of arginine metabolism
MHNDLPQDERQAAILRIVKTKIVGDQTELMQLLHAAGHAVTQSSVSRDLRELKIAKVDGRYQLPPEEVLRVAGDFAALGRFVMSITTAGPNLTVVKTTIGGAQSIAVVIDRADWPDVVGTVCGDDTLFIATADAAAQRQLVKRLREKFQV